MVKTTNKIPDDIIEVVKVKETTTLESLKSLAYDLIVNIQRLQNDLARVNSKILKLNKEQKDNSNKNN